MLRSNDLQESLKLNLTDAFWWASKKPDVEALAEALAIFVSLYRNEEGKFVGRTLGFEDSRRIARDIINSSA